MKESAIESRILAEPNTGCWIWLGAVTGNGYGSISLYPPKRTVKAHRYIYELHRGKIPAGLVLDHLCRNRRCVNPSHLEPVTQRENLLRGFWPSQAGEHNRSKRRCPKGHQYTADNLMRKIRRSGEIERRCRECHRIYMVSYNKRRRYVEKGQTEGERQAETAR